MPGILVPPVFVPLCLCSLVIGKLPGVSTPLPSSTRSCAAEPRALRVLQSLAHVLAAMAPCARLYAYLGCQLAAARPGAPQVNHPSFRTEARWGRTRPDLNVDAICRDAGEFTISAPRLLMASMFGVTSGSRPTSSVGWDLTDSHLLVRQARATDMRGGRQPIRAISTARGWHARSACWTAAAARRHTVSSCGL